jgi:hypothetical protein
MITGKLVSAFTVLSIYKMEGAVVLNIPTETFYTVQSNEQSLGIDIDGNGTQDFRFGGVTRIGSLIVTERNNRYFGKAASFPDLGDCLLLWKVTQLLVMLMLTWFFFPLTLEMDLWNLEK